MKRLLLMRHAKSSWADPGQSDFDRPLNERGERDALRIGAELKKRRRVPDLVLTSPAVRALTTAKRVRLGGFPHVELREDGALYGASPETILEAVRITPESVRTLLVIAHNPGMHEAVEWVTREPLERGMKTATVACIELPQGTRWEEAAEGSLEWVLYPGDLE